MPDRLTVQELPATALQTGSHFGPEEWENWMQWDPAQSLSHSPPPLFVSGGSLGSTSPSELESLPSVPSFYQMPPTPSANPKKRKSSVLNDGHEASGNGRQPRGKKISHNIIEKRYRSNLNDKIARLRDSVPELRTAPPTVKRRGPKAPPAAPAATTITTTAVDSDGSGDDGGAGLKFNKATVLTKATEYIQQLERQNQRLQAELSTLRHRGGNAAKAGSSATGAEETGPFGVSTALQTSILQGLMAPALAANPPTPKPVLKPETEASGATSQESKYQAEEDQPAEPGQGESEASPSVTETKADSTQREEQDGKGMIPVPDAFRRLREEALDCAAGFYLPFTPQAPPQPSSDRAASSSAASPTSPTTASPASSSSLSHRATAMDPPPRPAAREPIIFPDADEPGDSWSRSRAMSRILIGSLAGLMVIEGFSENEGGGASSGTTGGTSNGHPRLRSRGLFALPAELLTESRGFREPVRRRIVAFQAGRAYPLLFVSALFVTVALAVAWYLSLPAGGGGGGAPRGKLWIDERGDDTATPLALDRPPTERAAAPDDNSGAAGAGTAAAPSAAPRRASNADVLRDFLARQLARCVGFPWPRLGNTVDRRDEEEAPDRTTHGGAGGGEGRAGEWRRWLADSQLLPRLWHERCAG